MWRTGFRSVKLRSAIETLVLAAFAASVLVVVALSATAVKVARDATAAAHMVAHTHEVLGTISRLRGDTLQIEMSTQNFRQTGETRYVEERNAILANREQETAALKRLTHDNAAQQIRWQQLRAVLDERMALSRQVELLRQTQGAQAANAFIASAPLVETRARVHRILGDMHEAEMLLLEQRNAAEADSRHVVLLVGLALALTLLCLLVGTWLLIRRQLRNNAASQQALRASEERLDITLRSIGDAVLATDVQGRVTRMNPVAEQLTGWPFAEAEGRAIEEVFRIVHEQTRAAAEVPVARVLATGEVQLLAEHTVLIARDGSECPIADSAAPLRDRAGTVQGVVLVFRDETTQRQAQRLIRGQNELLDQRVRERTAQLHQSQDHLRSVMGSVPAMIAYVDTSQRYVYVNQQYRENFAPDRDSIDGCTVREVLGDERYAAVYPLITGALDGRPQHYDYEPRPGVWQSIEYLPKRDARGRVIGYYVQGSDITERKLAEDRIVALNGELGARVQELEHVSRALRTLSAGNRAMLRGADEQDLLDSMCQAIVAEGGYDMAAVFYRVDDERKTLQPMAQHGYPWGIEGLAKLRTTWADDELGRGAGGGSVRTGEAIVVRDIMSNPHYAGWRPFLPGKASVVACPLHMGGEVVGTLCIYDSLPETFDSNEVRLLCELAEDLAFGIASLRARAEQQRVEQAMHRLTRFDALTGLPNENQFTQAVALAIEQGAGRGFAALQTNIERLSDINDALGFSHGDQMLREFGSRLRAAAPASALVARLRGDEFAILLPESERNAAIDMVQRLDAALAEPFQIGDIPLDVSAQTGVVLFPEHGGNLHDLLRHMDIAVHQAKRRGVAHALYDPSLNQHQPSRLNMAGELRRGIEAGELRMFLQPKIELASGRVSGAEALVRWQHPERGLLAPGLFIGLAEHTGLIRPLTEWMIESVLRLNNQWDQDGRALPIAVNLSARNLHDGELLDKVRRMLVQWQTRPGLLELEITESTVMEDAAFSLGVLHGLRDEGIPLYIDDFGTGYSSLSYLQKIPVDFIKIDQSFVKDMSTSKDAAAIVRSTIDLVHDLGRKTVAEGVETQGDWDALSELGCDAAQGYFIAKPMPAEHLQGWLQRYAPPISASMTLF